METTPFDLTPEQKGLLASLARETGKPIPVLLAEALEELQEHVRSGSVQRDTNGSHDHDSAAPPTAVRKPISEQFIEAFKDVPEEELERLPVDGATQHDHYIYGTPKRPA